MLITQGGKLATQYGKLLTDASLPAMRACCCGGDCCEEGGDTSDMVVEGYGWTLQYNGWDWDGYDHEHSPSEWNAYLHRGSGEFGRWSFDAEIVLPDGWYEYINLTFDCDDIENWPKRLVYRADGTCGGTQSHTKSDGEQWITLPEVDIICHQ